MRDVVQRRSRSYGAGAVLADRYRLSTTVGRGATADVYAADDERLGRPVAIKLFHHTADEVEQQRIENEMRTLAALRHPALVAVFDAGYAAESADQHNPFLVMELITGESLRQRLSRGPLPLAEARVIGRNLAEGLAYVHALGLVHRDVKPANILLDEQPCDPRAAVKLADFGIARLSSAPRLTSHGTAVGTANYLSPEQVTGADVGPPSDIYSLGLVLLECITGQTVYSGTGVEAALARLHRDPLIPTRLPRAWVELLAAMTSRQPNERPSAEDVAARLERIEDELFDDGPMTASIPTAVHPAYPAQSPGHTAVLPVPIPPAAGPPRRRRALGYAIGLVSAALLVLAVVIAAGSSGSPRLPILPRTSTSHVNVAPVTSHAASKSPAASKSSAPAAPPRHGRGKHKH